MFVGCGENSRIGGAYVLTVLCLILHENNFRQKVTVNILNLMVVFLAIIAGKRGGKMSLDTRVTISFVLLLAICVLLVFRKETP